MESIWRELMDRLCRFDLMSREEDVRLGGINGLAGLGGLGSQDRRIEELVLEDMVRRYVFVSFFDFLLHSLHPFLDILNLGKRNCKVLE